MYLLQNTTLGGTVDWNALELIRYHVKASNDPWRDTRWRTSLSAVL
jgi:hypothetical protein